MKKTFAIAITLLFVFALALSASAEGVTPEAAEETIPEAAETPTEPTESPVLPVEPDTPVTTPPTEETPTEEELEPNFFSRLYEAWQKGDIMDIAVLLYSAFITVFMFVLKHSGSVASLNLVSRLEATEKKLNELVGASNSSETKLKEFSDIVGEDMKTVIDEVLKNRIADNGEIKQLNEQQLATSEAIKAFASMLQSIYAGSTTIPQPVKDIVNAKYVEIVEAVNKAKTESKE